MEIHTGMDPAASPPAMVRRNSLLEHDTTTAENDRSGRGNDRDSSTAAPTGQDGSGISGSGVSPTSDTVIGENAGQDSAGKEMGMQASRCSTKDLEGTLDISPLPAGTNIFVNVAAPASASARGGTAGGAASGKATTSKGRTKASAGRWALAKAKAPAAAAAAAAERRAAEMRAQSGSPAAGRRSRSEGENASAHAEIRTEKQRGGDVVEGKRGTAVRLSPSPPISVGPPSYYAPTSGAMRCSDAVVGDRSGTRVRADFQVGGSMLGQGSSPSAAAAVGSMGAVTPVLGPRLATAAGLVVSDGGESAGSGGGSMSKKSRSA